MTKISFAAAREKAEEAGLLKSGGIYRTLENGDNRFRLVSEGLERLASTTASQRSSGCVWCSPGLTAVKPYFMPTAVYEQIEALQLNPDYGFDESRCRMTWH